MWFIERCFTLTLKYSTNKKYECNPCHEGAEGWIQGCGKWKKKGLAKQNTKRNENKIFNVLKYIILGSN